MSPNKSLSCFDKEKKGLEGLQGRRGYQRAGKGGEGGSWEGNMVLPCAPTMIWGQIEAVRQVFLFGAAKYFLFSREFATINTAPHH